MAYCRDCGAQLEDTAAYCPSCGAPSSEVAEQEHAEHEHVGHQDTAEPASENTSPASAAGQAGQSTSPAPAAAGRAEPSSTGATGTSASTTEGTLERYTTGQKVLFGGAALTVIGAFLPWMSMEFMGTSMTVNGIDGDGVITLILGLLAGGVGLFRWGRIARGSVVALGALVAVFGIGYISDPTIGAEFSSQASAELARNAIDPSVGLYLTAIGGVGILAGPIVDYLT